MMIPIGSGSGSTGPKYEHVTRRRPRRVTTNWEEARKNAYRYNDNDYDNDDDDNNDYGIDGWFVLASSIGWKRPRPLPLLASLHGTSIGGRHRQIEHHPVPLLSSLYDYNDDRKKDEKTGGMENEGEGEGTTTNSQNNHNSNHNPLEDPSKSTLTETQHHRYFYLHRLHVERKLQRNDTTTTNNTSLQWTLKNEYRNLVKRIAQERREYAVVLQQYREQNYHKFLLGFINTKDHRRCCPATQFVRAYSQRKDAWKEQWNRAHMPEHYGKHVQSFTLVEPSSSTTTSAQLRNDWDIAFDDDNNDDNHNNKQNNNNNNKEDSFLDTIRSRVVDQVLLNHNEKQSMAMDMTLSDCVVGTVLLPLTSTKKKKQTKTTTTATTATATTATATTGTATTATTSLPKQTLLSEDERALALAKQYNVSILATSEALEALMEPWKWNFAVTSLSLQRHETVVVLEDPLPRARTVRETLEIGFREPLVRALVNTNTNHTNHNNHNNNENHENNENKENKENKESRDTNGTTSIPLYVHTYQLIERTTVSARPLLVRSFGVVMTNTDNEDTNYDNNHGDDNNLVSKDRNDNRTFRPWVHVTVNVEYFWKEQGAERCTPLTAATRVLYEKLLGATKVLWGRVDPSTATVVILQSTPTTTTQPTHPSSSLLLFFLSPLERLWKHVGIFPSSRPSRNGNQAQTKQHYLLCGGSTLHPALEQETAANAVVVTTPPPSAVLTVSELLERATAVPTDTHSLLACFRMWEWPHLHRIRYTFPPIQKMDT